MGIVERLFPDQKLVLLRYAVISMREMLDGPGILQDLVMNDPLGKISDAGPASSLVL